MRMQEAALDMVERKSSPLREAYAKYISSYLDKTESGNTKGVHQRLLAGSKIYLKRCWFPVYVFCNQVAACLMECTMHGAGGMDMIDPLFQLTMADISRERKIPVAMDEVFSGLWRLGRISGCSFSVNPAL